MLSEAVKNGRHSGKICTTFSAFEKLLHFFQQQNVARITILRPILLHMLITWHCTQGARHNEPAMHAKNKPTVKSA